MKTIKKISLLLTSILLMHTTTLATTIKLNEAIQNKKVSCVIKGNTSSTHYYEPILIEISNLSNSTINLAIESGDMFIPSDSTLQNIVVTEEAPIVLLPKATKKIKIKGMCTERGDGAGSETTTYTFLASNNDTLKKLSKFIAQNKYHTSAAQFAVWTLMDNDDINGVISADTTEENKLKQLLATLTGKTYTVKQKNSYKTNYYAPPREKVSGMFEYNFIEPKDIQIAMFDSNGILVRELYNQKSVAAGSHKINFAYDASVYKDDLYYFKLIANNEILVNREWDAKKIRDAFKNKIENRN